MGGTRRNPGGADRGTGGLMVLAIAPMRVDHPDVATLELFPFDIAKERIQALNTTAHQRAQLTLGLVDYKGQLSMNHYGNT